MGLIDIIICIVLVCASTYFIIRAYAMRGEITRQRRQIQIYNRLILLSRISSDHVSEEQLQKVTAEAQLALRKSKGIDRFDGEVRPMVEYVIQSSKKIVDSQTTDEERHSLSLSIKRQVKKLSNFVENVLLLARIDSKRITYSSETLRVGDLVHEIYEEHANVDAMSGAGDEPSSCKLGIIEGRPTLCISADRLYLKKAIGEVLTNAFSFSVNGGDIFMGWFYRLGTNEVEIFIEDNGIGIPEECQPHVFDVFYKAHQTKGFGIGLSITQELVNKMGGHIELVSRPNIGTRVSLLFPLASY